MQAFATDAVLKQQSEFLIRYTTFVQIMVSVLVGGTCRNLMDTMMRMPTLTLSRHRSRQVSDGLEVALPAGTHVPDGFL